MKPISTTLFTFAAFLFSACTMNPATHPQAAKTKIDLENPADNLSAFLKMRGNIDGSDTVMWWSGQIFAVIPQEKPALLFEFEGINVARLVHQSDGSWRMLTREYAVYKDPRTGEILDRWQNPYTKADVAVFNVQNDPVNSSFGSLGRDGKPRMLPLLEMGGDCILGFDVPLAYPNPISQEKFPEHSTGPTYTGSEHFGFYSRIDELSDPRLTSVPTFLAWFREGPWLPWMKMGQRPGLMVYSGYGKKLMGGIDEIPPAFLAHLRERAPKYLSAPREFVTPNATSWTVFLREVLEPKSGGG